jgi:hypothetical protein
MLVEDMSRNRCFSWFEYNIFLFYIHLWPLYWLFLVFN